MKRIQIFLGILMVLSLFSACTAQPTAPLSDVATSEPPSTSAPVPAPSGGVLDPALPEGDAAVAAVAAVYEGLVRLEEDAVVPVLVMEGTVSEDRLDYILPLRPGVTFHDGSTFNADAVIANFNRWFDPADALHGGGAYEAWAANFGGFKGETDASGKPKSTFDGIEKVNDLTILIHLNTADEELLKKLADPAFAIASPAALAAPGFGTPDGVDGGTGKYKVSDWSEDTLTLEPYAEYWDASVLPTENMEIPLN